jgi:peptidoglycan-associated lipoprotein
MTPRTRYLLAAACLWGAAATGCSHEQPPPTAKPRAAAPAPKPPVREAAEPAPSPPAEVADSGKDDKEAVYFDFDSSLLRDEARPVLQKVATIARKQDASVRIEGNCDDVGTVEYNLALGEQRARQAKDYLVHMGVPSKKIETISFGSGRPKANGHDDAARAENRRDDLILR